MSSPFQRTISSDRLNDKELMEQWRNAHRHGHWQEKQQYECRFIQDLIDLRAEIMIRRLRSNDPTLVEFKQDDFYCISRCCDSQFTSELLAALRSNSTLERVVFYTGSLAGDPRHLPTFGELVPIVAQMKSLKELCFNNCEVSLSDFRYALEHAGPGLYRFGLDSAWSTNHPRFRDDEPSDAAIIAFAEVLRTTARLPRAPTAVEFGRVKTNVGLKALLELVQDNDTVEELNYNYVGGGQNSSFMQEHIAMYLCLNKAGRRRLTRQEVVTNEDYIKTILSVRENWDEHSGSSQVYLSAIYFLVRAEPNVLSRCSDIHHNFLRFCRHEKNRYSHTQSESAAPAPGGAC